MLWLALHFPLLPLEALDCRCPSETSSADAGLPPAVVLERGRVALASPSAAAIGIQQGMGLSSALGLVPGLAVFERQTGKEGATLQELAYGAGRFTPLVSLVPPATLLLEIGGCLRLFGGLNALREAVLDACSRQGYTVCSAVAPTPLGATWLAWAGKGDTPCLDVPALNRSLAGLSCTVPAWDQAARGRLRAFGMETLADVMALPQGELARRIGLLPVAELERARGEAPDLRPWFVFPEKFALSLELPAKVESAPMLVFAGQRLLAALCGWLAVREAAVAACLLRLIQEGGGVTEVVLRPAEATREETRLLRLLRERLDRLDLAAPVLELELRADDILSLPGSNRPLFAGERAVGEGALRSLERLRARLGETQVFTLTARPDYRPECASGRIEPTGEGKPQDSPAGWRPLWLLPEPRLLSEVDGRPQWGGAVSLLAGPERLESGWWDEGEEEGNALGDVRRDYFVAGNAHGQRLWIFRNAQGWFLHGLFP